MKNLSNDVVILLSRILLCLKDIKDRINNRSWRVLFLNRDVFAISIIEFLPKGACVLSIIDSKGAI